MTVSTQVLPAPAPVVLPEIKTYWDATAEGRLLLPKCEDCQAVIWFPRPFCPECASLNVAWVEASGRGSIYSFTVNVGRSAATLLPPRFIPRGRHESLHQLLDARQVNC